MIIRPFILIIASFYMTSGWGLITLLIAFSLLFE